MSTVDSSKQDDQKFNQTLKRMLATPPKPHDTSSKDKRKRGDGGPEGNAKQSKERR